MRGAVVAPVLCKLLQLQGCTPRPRSLACQALQYYNTESKVVHGRRRQRIWTLKH